MHRNIDAAVLETAWTALSEQQHSEPGWQSIQVAQGRTYSVLVARDFPSNSEAVLVGFISSSIPGSLHLPSGKGFEVTRIAHKQGPWNVWLALSKAASGSIELFTTMVTDLLSTLHSRDDQTTIQLEPFLSRIHAWQSFMQRDLDGRLGSDAETGLFGELVILEALAKQGVKPAEALTAWKGPAHGLHDFSLSTAAIEVKTAAASQSFRANIGNLDQLDDSVQTPLYLAAVRLETGPGGRTLPEFAGDIGELFPDDGETYDLLLLQAGLLRSRAATYRKKFICKEIRLLLVSDHFPRLIRANVAASIVHATYTIDLDMLQAEGTPINEVLGQAGCS